MDVSKATRLIYMFKQTTLDDLPLTTAFLFVRVGESRVRTLEAGPSPLSLLTRTEEGVLNVKASVIDFK